MITVNYGNSRCYINEKLIENVNRLDNKDTVRFDIHTFTGRTYYTIFRKEETELIDAFELSIQNAINSVEKNISENGLNSYVRVK